MDIRKLQRAIVDGLEDVKAQHIVVFNTEHLSPLFERVIVASGTSNRQTKALAASVRDAVKSSGQQVLRTEGEDNGEWIIVDCGAAVAHIMQPAIRDYYRLEEIWGGKPVKLKLADDKVSLPKASESDDDDEPVPAKKKPAAKKAPAKSAHPARTEKSAAGRAALGKASPKRKSADDAPVAVKKPAPARKVSSGKIGAAAPAAKKAPARKAAAPKPVAKKAPARKAAPVKAAAKKAVPAKKAPAKKAAPRKATAR
ncbi:MAG TPA: ribosome silencing factor [Ideonella sp.]|uniref:ribosome silencing factor n=1 Tax=Ideonella sp. TaxID=1929293 RepID=UPI002E35393C|nr:ribosome silencing factor [Ideonella sp.]HEX5684065.1 ribosome silencing factor [Ideonella sp.]